MAVIRSSNIYYMLAYAYRNLRNQGLKDLDAEEFDHINDVFAAILAQGMKYVLRHGLNKDFRPETEELSTLRGKIDLAASFKQLSFLRGRLVCKYDLFSEDNQLNRILKTVLALLSRAEGVSVKNRQELKRYLTYFVNVAELNLLEVEWNSIRYTPSNRYYQTLMSICQLFCLGLIQKNCEGRYKLKDFEDEQALHVLFENFVRAFYEIECSRSYRVAHTQIKWNVPNTADVSLLPVMQTDMVLEQDSKKLIIDTKYYGRSLQSNYNRQTIISGNLYQIYTYVKNLDVQHEGRVAGMLLYAKTAELSNPDNMYEIDGNYFFVKTLDLGKPWNGEGGVKAQLLALPQVYFGMI
jgi:5-methylcytosine-specific restriction enzyme subunit McrC